MLQLKTHLKIIIILSIFYLYRTFSHFRYIGYRYGTVSLAARLYKSGVYGGIHYTVMLSDGFRSTLQIINIRKITFFTFIRFRPLPLFHCIDRASHEDRFGCHIDHCPEYFHLDH